MRTFTIGIALTLLLLAACGPATPSAAPTLMPDASQPASRPTPTPEAPLPPEASNQEGDQPAMGYPPPATPVPLPEGYPVAPAFVEPFDPYPGAETSGRVWVTHPFGQQCRDVRTYKYANVQDARASLVAAGVTTYEVTTIEKMVCEACDCPTSAHYRAEIAAADLNKAMVLGWTEE